MTDKPKPEPQNAAITGPEPSANTELRSFGRRHGRRLRTRQAELVETLLPSLSIDLSKPTDPQLAGLFPEPVENLWLEIGFGGGEHLIWQAANNPDSGIIGCEPFIDGVAKVLSEIDRRGLSNIRLLADDARDLIRWLPPAAIDRAFILFPDPWPKLRHRKRRLINAELVSQLARVMPPGAELRLATDIGDYAGQMLALVLGSDAFDWQAARPADWRQRPPGWPQTRYEQKAIREGRPCYFLSFVRTGS